MLLHKNLQLTQEQKAAIEAVANKPEVWWDIQSKSNPKLMANVDVMLVSGMTPEWILMRGDFGDLPVEIQTMAINSLHWRQSKLRSARK